MCLKESCFPDGWKVSLVVPAFKNVEERSTAKNYHSVTLLLAVSKIFYDFHCGFRSSLSTVDLLTIVSDRIARASNSPGAT